MQCAEMAEEIRDNVDNREWSAKHLEAAGHLPPPAPSPPAPDHVDVRGPGGYTPLMVASFSGTRRRQSGPDSDSTGSTDLDLEETAGTAAAAAAAGIITDLINHGAAVNAATDRTGEYTQHTHPFNGPLSGTTRVSRYQKGKTDLDFTGARDSEWQWHQLGDMQVCTSLQTDNHASTSPLKFLQFFYSSQDFLCEYTQGVYNE